MRLNGRSITYVSPEQRTRLGIQLLPGGEGVFGDMTVPREPARSATYIYRNDDADDGAARSTRVLELFPELAERRDDAGVVAVGRPAADAGARAGSSPASPRC